MESTILIGDYIIVDKIWTRKQTPERGDIIVFKSPLDGKLDFIKRCVVVGGDTISMRGKQFYINGIPQEEEYAQYLHQRPRSSSPANTDKRIRRARFPLNRGDFGPFVVPKDELFVLGDNRDNSSDSRIWGYVPQENIIGKAGLVYFSFRKGEGIRWSRIGKMLEQDSWR